MGEEMNKRLTKSSTFNTVFNGRDRLQNFLQNKLNKQYNVANLLSAVCVIWVGRAQKPSIQKKGKKGKEHLNTALRNNWDFVLQDGRWGFGVYDQKKQVTDMKICSHPSLARQLVI